MHEVLLVAASFLACAVEMVEALTIVLAVGVTRGWRSAIIGTAAALGAVGAVAAAVVVLLVGLVVHRPLSQVPENTMKYAVGVMLTTFGMFWAGEGAGINWPGSDAALIGLLAYVLVISALLTAAL